MDENINPEIEALLERFHSGDLQEQIQASSALMKFGSVVVEPLIKIVADDSLSHLWWLAASDLGYIGDKRAVEPLINLLKNPVSFKAILARKYTAYALYNLADPRAVDVLIGMLHERIHEEETEDDGTIRIYDELDDETIEAAAEALAHIGEWRGIEAVIQLLLEGDSWYDHRIGEWGGERAFQLLFENLQSKDDERRATVASLIGEFGDRRAVEPLIELLNTDSSDRVRKSAAYGLYELRDARAFIPLLVKLDDHNHQVRRHAASGLSHFMTPNLYRRKENEPTLESLLKQTLSEIGVENVVDHLLNALENIDPTITQCVIQLINEFLPLIESESLKTKILHRLKEIAENPDRVTRLLQATIQKIQKSE